MAGHISFTDRLKHRAIPTEGASASKRAIMNVAEEGLIREYNMWLTNQLNGAQSCFRGW
jgi:hypothetical protein